MIVVSDTTALSCLLLIGHLEWLPQLFQEVVIPVAVQSELEELRAAGFDMSSIDAADWLTVRAVQDAGLVKELLEEMDLGESEAIALALEINSDFLLIDERRGTLKAAEYGVETIGLLRVILELKRRGVISSVKTVLEQMRSSGGFWVSNHLFQRVLIEAGENEREGE